MNVVPGAVETSEDTQKYILGLLGQRIENMVDLRDNVHSGKWGKGKFQLVLHLPCLYIMLKCCYFEDKIYISFEVCSHRLTGCHLMLWCTLFLFGLPIQFQSVHLCIIYTGNSNRIHTIPIHSATTSSQKSPKSDACYKDFRFSTFSIWILAWKAQTHLIMLSLQSSNIFLFISDKKSTTSSEQPWLLFFNRSCHFQNFTSEEKCVDMCQPLLLISSAIAVANPLYQTLCYILNLGK